MVDWGQLEKYADVAIEIGVGLRAGDRLLIRSSVDAVELTRLVVERAYSIGAANVDVLWADDHVSRARFSHGSEAASRTVSTGAGFLMEAHRRGDLVLTIDAKDPSALAGQDLSKVGSFQRINGEYLEPFFTAMSQLEVNWSIIAAPTPDWARLVFPDASASEAVDLLWAAIFRACRIDVDDPVRAWRNHLSQLGARKRDLNEAGFRALRYAAPGTDLTLGLPDRARWEGGQVETTGGRQFAPNIPTEEIFTSPHRMIAEGTVRATKPLSLFGNLVENFQFEVEGGRVVAAEAERGQEALDQLLSIDEGSSRLGEAAMVPMSSAVANEGLVWSNTLFDENDGCHIAIGRAYPVCVEGGTAMTRQEQLEAGLNSSTTHVDFVVGSPDLDVFGVTDDGVERPIIEAGEWAFEPV